MSIAEWNAVMNIVTNFDYLAIPVAFLVLRNLREPDVPARILLSRMLFVLLCGAHHGVMALVLLSGEPHWVLRTSVNAAMAIVSCWALFEHVMWARVRPAPVSASQFAEVQGQAKALAASNEELERFAFVASHDLQEPLRMIASYSQLLEDRYKDRLDDEGRVFIGHMVDGAKRMQALIQDVLTLSRVDEVETEATFFSLDELVDEVLQNLEARMSDRQVEIIRHPLPVLAARRTHIAQLMQNLLDNAIKYSRNERVRIEISAEPAGEVWHFRIRDDGIGIDPAYHERIFRVFERLHTRREFDGTGLGLALCRKIVKRHGGEIWVHSREGDGATFTFSLPSAAVRTHAGHGPASRSAPEARGAPVGSNAGGVGI